MIEIFSEIPVHIKEQAKLWVDLALRQTNPAESIKIMEEFRNLLKENEKDFCDFYFNMRLEELKN